MSKAALVVMAAGLASRYGGEKQVEGMGPHGEILLEYSIHDAMRAGFDYHEYMDAMGERLDHVHAYDFDADGKECLPGKGLFDFARFGDELRARGYDGAVIIEAYPYMYRDTDELLEALEYLKRTMGARE